MRSYRIRTNSIVLAATLLLASVTWAQHYNGYHDGDADFDRDMPDTRGLRVIG